jgi:hypothetical protein
VPAPDSIRKAVEELSKASGHLFQVTDAPVDGTALYVVYARDHSFPEQYSVRRGTLGFRVPQNIPDACPEDAFFIQPHQIKLKTPDPVRHSTDIHRAGATADFLKGTEIGTEPALVFSWHLWNKGIWNRNKHTLIDHYTHCLRRFDEPEHDH